MLTVMRHPDDAAWPRTNVSFTAACCLLQENVLRVEELQPDVEFAVGLLNRVNNDNPHSEHGFFISRIHFTEILKVPCCASFSDLYFYIPDSS